MKQVLCEIGDNTYGIDIAYVQGIEKQLDIVQVPNAPEMIDGIANLRQIVIPIFSLYKKFKVEPKPVTEDTKYIILRMEDMFIGFRVDAVSEIVEVAEDDFHELPSVVASEETGYVDKIIQVGKKLVVVIDVQGVLSEKEKHHIAKLIEEQ